MHGVEEEMFQLARQLFPINRSITGNGVRKTLKILRNHIPLKIKEVPTGTRAFDWVVPKEWNVKDAYVSFKGKKIIDFKNNNLHLVGYSIPVSKTISLQELQEHLHSIKEMPDAIPYITSYYRPYWGFCLPYNQRKKLKDGKYQVVVDSELKKGNLTYGEIIIKGRSRKEVLFSVNICHPSLANNELSGMIVATYLTKWILTQKRKYTYRIVFIPETIGSIVYLSKNLKKMKENTIAGFVMTCVGDEGGFSYIPSRKGNTYGDKVAQHVLKFKKHKKYTWLDRGSDERQYCSPGVDLPVVSITKSLYAIYPEYHTSLDNLDFISGKGLGESVDIFKECIELIERNDRYKISTLCEPQLGKRHLYPKENRRATLLSNLISYLDGTRDLIDISHILDVPACQIYPFIDILKKEKLIVSCS